MPIQGIPGIQTQEQLREHVLARACFDAAENERIYRKWFTRTRPRDRLFMHLDERLGITKGTVADVGCNFGMNLVYAPPGSYGIELVPKRARFARSIGLTVHERDVITDDLSDVPLVDTVYCAATLEHVDAPHIFLRRLYYLLKPGGRLVLEVPCAIGAPWLRRIPGMKHLFEDHDDHINSFTETSLLRFCERAGFAEQTSFRYSTPLLMRRVPVWVQAMPPFTVLGQSVVYVGRMVPGWDYPAKASRTAANNPHGYVSRGSAEDQESGAYY